MRTFLTILAAVLLAIPLGGAAPVAGDEGWATAAASRVAQAHGVTLDDLVVERLTLRPDGGVSRTLVPARGVLAELDERYGGAFGSSAAAEGAPLSDTVVGELPVHLMVQFSSCDGYGFSPIASDVGQIDAAWEMGIHVVVGPVAGGLGFDTGDPAAGLIAVAHEDRSLSAIGSMWVREDRLIAFGQCIMLIGQMYGTGVFRFNEA